MVNRGVIIYDASGQPYRRGIGFGAPLVSARESPLLLDVVSCLTVDVGDYEKPEKADESDVPDL